MSLSKGQIKIGKKKIHGGTWRFSCKRYLKKNYNFVESELKDKYRYEILDEIKIDNLKFKIDIEFNGIKPKEIELRSVDMIEENKISIYEEWVKKELNLPLKKNEWVKGSFKWGNVATKLTKLNDKDKGCLTLKLKYK